MTFWQLFAVTLFEIMFFLCHQWIMVSVMMSHLDLLCLLCLFTFYWLHSSPVSPPEIKMTLIPQPLAPCAWEHRADSGRESSQNRSWAYGKSWFVLGKGLCVFCEAQTVNENFRKIRCKFLYTPIQQQKRLGLYFQEMNKPARESWPSHEQIGSE